jgi:hypothetical protein
MDDVAVIAGVRSRRCCGSAGYRAQTSPDRGADPSAMPPASDGADHRPGAGPEQAAGDGALAGIVRVRVGGRRQQQSRPNHGGNTQLLSHSLLSLSKAAGRRPPGRLTGSSVANIGF